VEDFAVEMLVQIGVRYTRLQPFLGIAFRRIADDPLLVGQLPVQVERVRPIEWGDVRFAHLFLCVFGVGVALTRAGPKG
jgi:hypothetical protein